MAALSDSGHGSAEDGDEDSALHVALVAMLGGPHPQPDISQKSGLIFLSSHQSEGRPPEGMLCGDKMVGAAVRPKPASFPHQGPWW